MKQNVGGVNRGTQFVFYPHSTFKSLANCSNSSALRKSLILLTLGGKYVIDPHTIERQPDKELDCVHECKRKEGEGSSDEVEEGEGGEDQVCCQLVLFRVAVKKLGFRQ